MQHMEQKMSSSIHDIFKSAECYVNIYGSKEEVPFQAVQELKRDFLHFSDSLPLPWVNGESVPNGERTEESPTSLTCRSDSRLPRKARALSESEKVKVLWVRTCPKTIIRPNPSSSFRNRITWCMNCHALHQCPLNLLLLKVEVTILNMTCLPKAHHYKEMIFGPLWRIAFFIVNILISCKVLKLHNIS